MRRPFTFPMKAAELLTLLASLPPDTELGGELVLAVGDELSLERSSVTRAVTDAERARRYRERKRDASRASRDGRDGGGLGEVRPPKAESSEKREDFSDSPDRLDQGSVTERHETSRDGRDGGVTSDGAERDGSSSPVRSGGRSSEVRAKGVDGEKPGEALVFDFWRAETGHERAKLDPKRRRRIAARLREGFTVEELQEAIRNRRNDPFLMGQNDTGRVYDGLETLLRDAAQVERLRDLKTPPRASSRNGAPSGSMAQYVERRIREVEARAAQGKAAE